MSACIRSSIQIFIAAVLIYSQTVQCKEPEGIRKKSGAGLQKSSVNDSYAAMTVNNIFSYYTNNGDGSLNPFTGDGGFELINANRGITIFEEGFLWGGRHTKDSLIKVGGSTYNHGLQAGKIVAAGTTTTPPVAESAGLTKNRIFRVRSDIGPAESFSSVKEKITATDVALLSKYQSVTEQSIYDQYVADWNEWPASDGAPYTDVNNNGVYEPQIDIPGVPGADQTIWYVANDLNADRAYYMAGSIPIGIEFQRTIWAYNFPGPLGNTIFQKNILINKSGYDIDSMYIAQWTDPDLGGGLGYTDDFIGCDTTLSLGFVYNGDATDGFFGTAVPSMGFDFLQGPLVPGVASDSGKAFGKYIQGKKNLRMTSFNFFIGSNAIYADPHIQDPRGTIEWYNLMQGLIGRTGYPYIDPTTGNITKFVMAGDPLTGQGWVEGLIAPPGDRRMALCSGPFTLADGDTQEIVVGAIVAQGGERLESVRMLKIFDKTIQWMYDNNFEGPVSIIPPKVTVAELDKEIVLDWGNPISSSKTENNDNGGFSFQGYNIYQSPDTSFTNAKRIMTFDRKDGVRKIFDNIYDETLEGLVNKPVQFGNDTGIERFMIIDKNYLAPDEKNYAPLVNFQKYYFAVTAYNYSPDPEAFPRTFESSPQFVEAVPQPPIPGVVYAYNAGDDIPVAHTGISDGGVTVEIVNPKVLTGHHYSVTFDSTGGTTTWKVTDMTSSEVKISGLSQIAFEDKPEVYTVDGMSIATYGNSPGMSNWNVYGTRQWTWVGANWGMEGFTHAIGNAFDHWFSSSTVGYDKLKNVEIRFAQTDTGGNIVNANDSNASFGFRYLQNASSPPSQPSFTPFIINSGAGYPFQDYLKTVPLAAYDVESNPPRRLMVGYLENNQVDGLVDGKYWPPYNGHPIYGDNIKPTGPREWLLIFDVDYNETGDPLLQTDILNNTVPIMWLLTVTRRDLNGYAGNWKFTIMTNHINTVNDQYTFTPTALTNTVEQTKEDVKKVNVFPNPYFAANAVQNLGGLPHVTFTHLPRNATISILNLGGVRVRKLVKDDDLQTISWDLMNESGWLVAAGMYIAYIDLGTNGTKILKFAIIPERPSR